MAGFIAPVIKNQRFASAVGSLFWFYLGYRIYHDGGHAFLHKHAWEEPKHIEYLKKVDAKFGTHYATDNMHHH